MKNKITLWRITAICLTVWLSACGGDKNADKPLESPLGAEPKAKGAPIALDEGAATDGPDSDQNGVRDDIDALIDKSGETPASQAALRQLSVALRQAVTADIKQASALKAASDRINLATACVWERFEPAQAAAQVSRMEALNVNTKARFSRMRPTTRR